MTYIEATKGDIVLANRIAHEVLGRTLDELPPQTRWLLSLLRGWVTERCAATAQKQGEFRFTRRDVREATRWGDTQLKVHLARLVELEYVLRSFMWDVTIAGEGARPEVGSGLLEPLREYAWGYFLRLNYPERFKV